jgi:hypothetical protein
MIYRSKIVAGLTAALLTATTSFAMAQATGKENNATTGSEAGVGPASGAEKKGTPGMQGDMSNSSSSSEMKNNTPTSAGTVDEQAKNLRGHSETPTTGK